MENYQGIIANGGIVCYNYSADKISYFKSGGKIETLICPTNISETVLECMPREFAVLGACTNTLIDDGGVSGTVVSTSMLKGISLKNDGVLYSYAGESVSKLASAAKNYSLSGVEELNGIPGSVGGAVVMNAGCFGREIAEVIAYVDVLSDGNIERVSPAELGYGYRQSRLKGIRNVLVTGVGFNLKKSQKNAIADRMRSAAESRRARQPKEPSLGSVFRAADDGTPSGRLIEECGLKGMKRGGAQISEKHANFIINAGGATSEDYKCIVDAVKRSVYQIKNVELKREVIYLTSGGFDVE